jgi:hypothetical protein
MQAMSDVPAALWTMLAVYWMAGVKTEKPVLAGLAGSLAILTRPPLLLPLAVMLIVQYRSRPRAAVACGAAMLPGVIGLLLLQQQLYGSPFVSGHGGAGTLFTVSTFPHNLAAHARWFALVYTPLAPILIWLGYRSDRPFGRMIVAVSGAAALPYLFYGVPFDDWEMIRFLLPATALLTLLAGEGAAVLLRRVTSPVVRHGLLAVAAAVVLAGSGQWLESKGVFHLPAQESKYPRVGEWFSQHVPEDSVVLASLHSGSVEYYSGRLTLRWDAMPADRLAPTIAALAARGRAVYVVLDGTYEMEAFTRRFLAAGAPVRIEPLDRIVTAQIAAIRAGG